MTRLAIYSNNSVDIFPIVNNECCKVLCTSVPQEAEEMSQEEVLFTKTLNEKNKKKIK